VLSTPAVHLLKQHRPDLEIGIVVEDRFAGVFEGNPDIARVIPPSIRALRDFAPDVCLNLHGGTRSARLTALSGARTRSGFDIFRPLWIYNDRIPTAQETLGVTRRVHTAEHMASAVFHLGVPVSEVPRARMFAPEGREAQQPYAVIHPLAATPEKTWPRFAELASSLDLEPIFIGGPGEDLSAFSRWRTIVGAPISQIAQLMRDADLFIGNDSGPAHIAAAFNIPVLVFFGPSDEEVWAPWRTHAEVLKANPITDITVAAALKSLERLKASGRCEPERAIQ
jgi:ADP-heptose:LPS heptosyltransferase